MLLPPQGPSFPGGYDFARTLVVRADRRDRLSARHGGRHPAGTAAIGARRRGSTTLRARLTRRIEGQVRRRRRRRSRRRSSPATRAADLQRGQPRDALVGDGASAVDLGRPYRHRRRRDDVADRGRCCACPRGSRCAGRSRRSAAGAAAATGIAYTILAGAQVPTVRSCIGTVVVLLGVMLGREALSLRLLAAGGFIILAVRPEALLGPSFQLTLRRRHRARRAVQLAARALADVAAAGCVVAVADGAAPRRIARHRRHRRGAAVGDGAVPLQLDRGLRGAGQPAGDPVDRVRDHAAARRRAGARSARRRASRLVAARQVDGRADLARRDDRRVAGVGDPPRADAGSAPMRCSSAAGCGCSSGRRARAGSASSRSPRARCWR